MMTSVTLPTAAPIHGVFTSVAAAAEETNSSEPEFESPRPMKRCSSSSNAPPSMSESCKKRRKQATPVRISAVEANPQHPSFPTTSTHTTTSTNTNTTNEGKPKTPALIITTTTTTMTTHTPTIPTTTTVSNEHQTLQQLKLQCHVCQLYYHNAEEMQNHILLEHQNECKQEPPDEDHYEEEVEGGEMPLEMSAVPHYDSETSTPTQHLARIQPWMSEIPATATSSNTTNKDWSLTHPGMPNISFGGGSTATNQMFMTMSQFVQSDSMPRQQMIRIFNPDAYCELCNKEFCNKYFLKTHKANKHGIYTDAPISDASPSSSSAASVLMNNIASFSGAIKLPNSVPSVELPVKIEPKTSTSLNANSSFNNLFPNLFVNKSFPKLTTPSTTNNNKLCLSGTYDATETSDIVPMSANGLSSAVNGESDKIAVEESALDKPTSPRHLQNESTSYKQEPDTGTDTGVYYINQSKTSPSNEAELANRLRSIGVMNPKAFCEICCKEYCNKYFLRTHKLKRHGIYIPDERDKDAKFDGANLVWQANNIQTSPLNLIMTEQTSVDRKSPQDIRCDSCGIKFQNANLLQLHNTNVHANLFHLQQVQQTNDEAQDDAARRKAAQQIDVVEKSINNSEAISEDLQKLQTMILQLNELDVSKISATCTTCNKDFENRFFLHAHMMTEHGVLLDDMAEIEKQIESDSNSNNNNNNNNVTCDLCGKDVQTVEQLKKHILEFHSNHQSYDDKNEFVNTGEKNTNRQNERRIFAPMTNSTPTNAAQSSNNALQSSSMTPTSSYCDICNKELCNKYFMKTHMQRMHGIEIENGAQIGGVICDICNKELCSKYFLRVHKHNTHGIVEYGSSLLQQQQPRGSKSEIGADNNNSGSGAAGMAPIAAQPDDAALKPADLAELSHRYFTHFTEVCTLCSRRFRSTKWLKAHLLSDHGQVGAEKWAELEQQLQQSVNGSLSSNSNNNNSWGGGGVGGGGFYGKGKGNESNTASSNTLKIPNGGINNGGNNSGGGGQEKVAIQNVLSNLLGVTNDESTGKTYQCSFCPFTTSMMPLLFVHERSHTLEGALLKCPICGLCFQQLELLQSHMFTQHPLPTFPNGGSSVSVGGEIEGVGKFDEDDDNNEQSNNTVKDRTKQLQIELGSLQEIAKKAQVPATYAFPTNQEDGDYVMQAFLLEDSSSERKIAPAVVFLPVAQRQPSPFSVTFNLTPA